MKPLTTTQPNDLPPLSDYVVTELMRFCDMEVTAEFYDHAKPANLCMKITQLTAQHQAFPYGLVLMTPEEGAKLFELAPKSADAVW
jgi:hypothetical protein